MINPEGGGGMHDIGLVRVDLDECDSIFCPACDIECDKYTLEIELKHISAIKAGKEMYVPIAYLSCLHCGERLVMNDQLVIINLENPGK